MNIIWYGQSCFLLTTRAGERILIDPYYRFLGYRMPIIPADIVIVTHDHRDHNQLQAASGDYLLANSPLKYTCGDIQIHGVQTYHDEHNGAKRGSNYVFVIEADGLRICHAGDLGHQLTEQQVMEIGKVDILMVPVGGTKTIDGLEAVQVMKQLQPAITIPMHYRTKQLGVAGWLLFDKVNKFINAAGQKNVCVHELNVTQHSLTDYPGIVMFHHRQE